MGASGSPTQISKQEIDPQARAANFGLYSDAIRYLNANPYQAYGPASSMVAGEQPSQLAARQMLMRGLLGPNYGAGNVPFQPPQTGGPYGNQFSHTPWDMGTGTVGGGTTSGTGGNPNGPGDDEDGDGDVDADDQSNWDPMRSQAAPMGAVASTSRMNAQAPFSMQGLIDDIYGKLGPGGSGADIQLNDFLSQSIFGPNVTGGSLSASETPSRLRQLLEGGRFGAAKQLFDQMGGDQRKSVLQDAFAMYGTGNDAYAQPMFDLLQNQYGVDYDWSSIPRYQTTNRDGGQYVDTDPNTGGPVWNYPPAPGGGAGGSSGNPPAPHTTPPPIAGTIGGNGTPGPHNGGVTGGGPTQQLPPYTFDPSSFGAGVGTAELGLGTQATARELDYTPTAVQGGSFLGGPGIGAYQNPYNEQVVNTALSDIDRSRQLAQQDINSSATKARAFGGSRHGVLGAETNRAYADTAARTTAQLRSQGFDTAANLYGQDMARGLQAGMSNQQADLYGAGHRLGAAGQMAGMGGQALNQFLTGANALNSFGQQDQARAQAMIDADIQQFYEARNDPLRGLSLRQGILQGMPVSQSYTQYNPQSRGQGFAQGALGGAGVGSAFGPWGALIGGMGGGLLGLF